MWTLIRLVTLRHLLKAPLRSGLTVFGVAVGVATMVAVIGINRSVMEAFRSTMDTIAGKADLTVAAGQVGFSDEWVEKLKREPSLAHVSAAVTEVLPLEGVPGTSLMVLGVDLLDDGYFRSYEGVDREWGNLTQDLQFLNSTDRLLVSERFAREQNLRVGDSFRLVTSLGVQPFYVHALIREEGPIKAFGGAVAVMDLAAAQAAFGRDRRIDRIDLAVAPGKDVDAVAQRLRTQLGAAFDIERPSKRGSTVVKMIRGFQMGLNLGSGVALLVGVFLVYNTVAIGVLQRRREIGMLRALGTTRHRVQTLFTLEALVMGAVGTTLGLPAGLQLARTSIRYVSATISAIYVRVNATDVRLSTLELSLGIALGLLGSALAALRPATEASRIAPVEALRKDIHSGGAAQPVRSLPMVLGVTLALLALPLMWLPSPAENLPVGGYLSVFCLTMAASLLTPLFLKAASPLLRTAGKQWGGISGQLAADNFTRMPGRSAVPVAALALGVAMTVAIGGFVHSFQSATEEWIAQAVPADLFITSSAKLAGVQNTPMAVDIADELAQLPSVLHVDKVRIVPHDLLGLRIVIVVYTPEIHDSRGSLRVIQGREPTAEERETGAITVSENLARRRNLKVGQTLEMGTPTGLRRYWIAGVVTDFTSDQGTLFLGRKQYVEQFQDNRIDTFELYLKDQSQIETLRKIITERYGRKLNVFVLSHHDLRTEAKRLVESAFAVTYAMEGVAVLLALLGVINTLLSAVLDRTREIGLFRAVGAARAHVIRMFCTEAAFIGGCGALLGTATGWLLGLIITHVIGVESTGWRFPYLFPWSVALQMVAAAVVCAVGAGFIPARRAARLDVVEALAYE